MNKSISDTRKFLINRLGYLRNKANMSARELSQTLGYSPAYIAKFENGDFSIPAEVLLEAIEICNSTPNEFFYPNLEEYEQDKELIEILSTLSKDSKQTLIDLAKKLK